MRGRIMEFAKFFRELGGGRAGGHTPHPLYILNHIHFEPKVMSTSLEGSSKSPQPHMSQK